MLELVVSLEMFSSMKLGKPTLLVKKSPELMLWPSMTATQALPELRTMQRPTVLQVGAKMLMVKPLSMKMPLVQSVKVMPLI